MAGVIQKPDALSLSGNLKPFVVVTTETVSFVLKKGEVILLQQSYEPGPGNRIEIDIKDVVTATLLFQLNASQLAYIQPDLVANFMAKIGDTDYPFRVIRGGVSNLVDTAANWLKLHFLTWQPRVKEITYYSPEWLTYYAVDACSVKLKATYQDKTSRVITLHSCPAGTAVTLNVQYSVIAGKLGKTYPSYYEVWTETSGGAKLSETQVYAFSEILSEDEQWYIFENSLGGLDTFRAYGTNNLNAEHEHNVAEFGDVREEYQVDTERKYTKNTGYLDEYARRWMLDFFPSRAKYVYEATAIRKIVVTESNVTYISNDLPSSYTFTWQLAEVSALLNLVKNESDIPDNLVAPDLSSPDFILPPRLSEYPRVQLTEGVLIPAFDPFNSKPTVTTFGAIHDTIKNAVVRELEDELAGIGGGGDNPGGGCDLEIIESTELGEILPTDDNLYSAMSTDLRIEEELEGFLEDIDKRYLRKDVPDTAGEDITFNKNIYVKGELAEFNQNIFVKGEAALTDTLVIESIYSNSRANDFEVKGFYIDKAGDAWLGNLKVKNDSMFAGNLSSPTFVSGFPAGYGWALTWRDVMNAAGVLAKKAHLEIDDITVRGILRVYEMVISQLLGENGTHLTTDMMKIKSVDLANRIIYLDTEEGELYNPFWKGDIIMVQRFNGMPTAENGYYVTRQYEFVVEETHIGGIESGENRIDWIKFNNFVGDLAHIKERDTLVRVDNMTNLDRKGIIKQTSVEPGSPYMDIIYGMKTDPENAVRTRIGKLEGLITPYWGQLKDYGIMCDNSYLKGYFRLHTGEDVKTKFDIMENYFNSEMNAIRKEFPESNNLLKNASFSKDTLYWIAVNQMQSYQLGTNLIAVNGSLYSNKFRSLKLIEDGTRKVLKIRDNEIKQLNADITKIPDVVTADGEKHSPAYFISFRYRCTLAGKLQVGFLGSELYFEQDIPVTSEYTIFEAKGNWDGIGDFVLSFTGEIYLYALALTSNALEDTEIVLKTQILQTVDSIKLLGEKTDKLNQTQVNLGIELNVLDEQIKLYVNKMNNLEGTTTQLGLDINGLDEKLSLYANKTDSIQGTVTQLGIDLDAAESSINLWANRVTNVEGRVGSVEHSVVNVLPDQISAISSRVNSTETDIYWLERAGFITSSEAAGLFASKSDLKGDKIIGYINVQPSNIKISAKNIELDGRTVADYIEANGMTIGGFYMSGSTFSGRDNASMSINFGSYNSLNLNSIFSDKMLEVSRSGGTAIWCRTSGGTALYAEALAHSDYALKTHGNVEFYVGKYQRLYLREIVDNSAGSSILYSGYLCVHDDGTRKLLMIKQ